MGHGHSMRTSGLTCINALTANYATYPRFAEWRMGMSRTLAMAALLLVLVCIQPGQQAATLGAKVAASNEQLTAVALIPGPLTGLGSMGPHGSSRFCDPRAIGLLKWRAIALTHMLGLNKQQQESLSDLSAVSANAFKMIAASCESGVGDKSQLDVIEA